MKRIWSSLLALCLIMGQVAYAEVGTSGTGADSTIGIETVGDQSGRVLLTIFVKNEADEPLGGVTVKLLDPENPHVPPITGSDGTYVTDAGGTLKIKLFPSDIQQYKITIALTDYESYDGEPFLVTEHTEQVVVLKRKTDPPPGTSWYTVYYYAREGGLVSRASERVEWNRTPKHVPSPTPEAGWRFVGWTLNDEPVEPETVNIRKTTRFYAEFAKIPPVVPPTPTATVTPSPIPTPTVSPDIDPPPDKTPEPAETVPVGPENTHGGGTGGNNGGGSREPSPPNGGVEIPPTRQPGSPSPEKISPDVPKGPDHPEEPDSQSVWECYLHWIILTLALATLLCVTLRLRAIRRRMTELEETTKREEAPIR